MAYRITDISEKPIYRLFFKYRILVSVEISDISWRRNIGYRLETTDMPSLAETPPPLEPWMNLLFSRGNFDQRLSEKKIVRQGRTTSTSRWLMVDPYEKYMQFSGSHILHILQITIFMIKLIYNFLLFVSFEDWKTCIYTFSSQCCLRILGQNLSCTTHLLSQNYFVVLYHVLLHKVKSRLMPGGLKQRGH